MVDIADAMMAQRAYEANLAVMNITKSMALKATEIGKQDLIKILYTLA